MGEPLSTSSTPQEDSTLATVSIFCGSKHSLFVECRAGFTSVTRKESETVGRRRVGTLLDILRVRLWRSESISRSNLPAHSYVDHWVEGILFRLSEITLVAINVHEEGGGGSQITNEWNFLIVHWRHMLYFSTFSMQGSNPRRKKTSLGQSLAESHA